MQEADFSLGEYTAKKVACSVAVRKCKVSVADLEGIEHTVEVTAATLSEAMAAALATFREDEWVGQIGNGLTTVSVTVQQPAVQRQVRVKDFLMWLQKKGGSPAEVALKKPLRLCDTQELGRVSFREAALNLCVPSRGKRGGARHLF